MRCPPSCYDGGGRLFRAWSVTAGIRPGPATNLRGSWAHSHFACLHALVMMLIVASAAVALNVCHSVGRDTDRTPDVSVVPGNRFRTGAERDVAGGIPSCAKGFFFPFLENKATGWCIPGPTQLQIVTSSFPQGVWARTAARLSMILFVGAMFGCFSRQGAIRGGDRTVADADCAAIFYIRCGPLDVLLEGRGGSFSLGLEISGI